MAESLESIIGYAFRDPRLLKQALSHKSFASERGTGIYNERLEFLGDSVLAVVVAHQLYCDYPNESEGVLSKKKSLLVSRPSLAAWADALSLGSFLYLGVGEESTGGRERQSLLANTLEALIGAIYLDGGFDAATRFIREWCSKTHGSLQESDHKSRLQELIQKKFKSPPLYELTASSGPEHDKVFSVVVKMGQQELGRGSGKNKKEAEQAAALHALNRLSRGD